MRSKKYILEIKKRILQNFAGVRSELKFKDNYQLLVCVMLSAQCTDKRVNLITPRFFAEFPSVVELAKAAQVVLLEGAGANVMAVDTHVFRVAHRLGLSSAKTPELTERDLSEAFKTDLGKLHQGMVLFGRYTCKAIKPNCKECFLNELCSSKDKNFP